jgi:hypothetical protein
VTTGSAAKRNLERAHRLGVRPKILFLACYFPPSRSTASVRTWNIAKYLARRGWEVTVVTPDPSLWRHADDADKTARDLEREGVKRILTGYRWRNLSPDHMRCWNDGHHSRHRRSFRHVCLRKAARRPMPVRICPRLPRCVAPPKSCDDRSSDTETGKGINASEQRGHDRLAVLVEWPASYGGETFSSLQWIRPR